MDSSSPKPICLLSSFSHLGVFWLRLFPARAAHWLDPQFGAAKDGRSLRLHYRLDVSEGPIRHWWPGGFLKMTDFWTISEIVGFVSIKKCHNNRIDRSASKREQE